MLSRVHIFGAAGSGTTTLAASLCAKTGHAHLDTDDFFWMPTEPRYEVKRPVPERLALLEPELDRQERWVLSGALLDWGDILIPRFELVVFLYVPPEIRLERLRKRERARYGADRIAPGGDLHQKTEAFLEWAASYDTETKPDHRNLVQHEKWIESLTCPVLRLEGDLPPEEMLARVLAVVLHSAS